MAFYVTFHDFTHGQLDSYLKSRSDLDVYNKGALELKNFVIRAGGAAKTRFGTEYIAESTVAAPTSTEFPRPELDAYQIFAFEPSEEVKLLIILGAEPAAGPLSRLYYYMVKNTSGAGTPEGTFLRVQSTAIHPFTIDNAQVARVKYRTAQNQTSFVLVTGSQPPIVLTWVPVAAPNPSLVVKTLSFRRKPQHDFTSNGYTFQQPVVPPPLPPTPVAYVWHIHGALGVVADPIPISAPNLTPAQAPGAGNYPVLVLTNPLGTQNGILFNGFNYTTTQDDRHYEGGIVQMAGPVDDPTAPIGTALIVRVWTNTIASIRVLTPIDKSWRDNAVPPGVSGDQMVLTESAYSQPVAAPVDFPGRGQPRTVSFYESRLIFGGTRELPQSLFMSQIGNFANFDTGTGLADEGIAYTIASGAEDQIINMISGRSLQVFTTTNEFSAPVWSEQGLTPTTVTIRRQTSIGSSNCIPVILDNMTMYSKGGGKGVMAFESLNSGGNTYNSQDASAMSSELINNPVHMTSYVENEAYDGNLLFVINKPNPDEEGNLVMLQSLREQNVAAWTTAETEGEFVNIETVGSDVFIIAKRTNSAGVSSYSFEKITWELCMDASLRQTAAAPGVQPAITLPRYMQGQTVQMVAWTGDDPQKPQGVWLGSIPVPASGIITPDIPHFDTPVPGGYFYWIGLGFEQRLQTMPVDVKTSMGSMLFLKKKIYKVYIQFINSYPFFVNGIEADLRSLGFATGVPPGTPPGIQLNEPELPYEGIFMKPTMQKLNLPASAGAAYRGFVREATVLITLDRPLPMVIQGITAATS